MHVYSYSRFSTDRQTEASIIDQQRAQREFAQRRSWSITEYFTDEGISGAALGNRPGVLRMLDRIAAGDVLLVADLTRLSRSQDLAPLLERMRFKGVRVIGVLDNFDSNAPHARMQAGLSGLMSDELRANIRVRTHLALESRAKTARPTGGRAYGYDNAGNPVESEASIVRELFARYKEGESMSALVSDLNARGVPSPGASWNRKSRRKDGRWLLSALYAIFTNERYAGRVVWNRSVWVKDPDSGKRIRRMRPESEWIVNEGVALVDPDEWQATQARIRERGRSYGSERGAQPKYLLSGILLCEECGARLIIAGDKGSHYYCSTHRHGGDYACRVKIGVKRKLAEAIILKPLKDELLSPAAISKAAALIRQWHRLERSQGVQEPTADMKRLEAEIAELQVLMDTSPGLAARLRVSLDAAQTELDAKRRQAWRKASQMKSVEDVPAERAYIDFASRMADALEGKNMVAARAVLRQILGDVPVKMDETGTHLVATVNLNPTPLLKAAGFIDQVGSGGRI